MATNDTVDPAVREADLRVERAKASLLSRVEALKHRITGVKHKLDLQAKIAEHPLPAVAIAFALGAALALRRGDEAPGASRPARSALVTAVSAIGVHLVRELALGQLGQIARRWWAEQASEVGGPGPRTAGARIAEVEPYLEH